MATWVRGLVGTLALLALAQFSGLTEGLNRLITDAHWRAVAAGRSAPFPPDIVVVAIDDRTVDKIGRLRYWSRQRYAELLKPLRLAKVVGFDVLFTEPDAMDREGDTVLARAMREHGRVVVPWSEWSGTRTVSSKSLKAVEALLARLPRGGSAAGQLLDVRAVVNPSVVQPPLPGLVSASDAMGYADVSADPDGVYRTPVLVKATQDGQALMPHFSLAIACVARDVTPADALREAPDRLRLGDRTLPLFGGRLPLVPIARQGGNLRAEAGDRKPLGQPVPTVSFLDALQAPPEQFRDKVVLVGETATGTTDLRPNPLDPSLRGVELNAEILANLLHETPPRPLSPALQWLLILAAVLVPLWICSTLPPRAAVVGAVGVLLAVIAAMEGGFWGARVVPSWSPAYIGWLGATALTLLPRVVQEEAIKRQLRQSFSTYAPPELVEEIVRDPAKANQEGTRQRVAVLFSDIRNFTTYSEQNEPELVVRQMNEYLTEMTDAVLEQRGILDKFIGDAVMALFGPFLEEDVNVSARATAAAMQMLERLDRLNRHWEEEGLPQFRIGIGIHVGEAIVGNIGTAKRMQYTALGDTVNLASRLQSATKDLKAEIVVSSPVREEAGPPLHGLAGFTPRGTITVKGREQPVEVYEVSRAQLREEG